MGKRLRQDKVSTARSMERWRDARVVGDRQTEGDTADEAGEEDSDANGSQNVALDDGKESSLLCRSGSGFGDAVRHAGWSERKEKWGESASEEGKERETVDFTVL